MAKNPLEYIPLRDYVNGIIHENVVDEYKSPDNSVNEAVNLHFDQMGAVKLRPGTTLLATQIASSTDILGLHQFLDEGTGTNDALCMVNQTSLHYTTTGSSWTARVTGLTDGLKMRFTNFADRVMFTNGTDAVNSWDGNPSQTAGTINCVGAPTGHYIENYRSRVWLANSDANPSRLWYSSVVSSTGTITWDTTEGWLDVSPGDGEDITGIKRSPRSLLVFKPSNFYRILDINEADPDPQFFVGSYSQESIVEAKDGIYFHDWNNAAFHKYQGQSPVEISRAIQPYLEGVTLANRNDVAGWADADHVYWSCGNITLNGVTFSNVVFRYTISTEVWTIYSYPQQFLVGTWYDDASTREPVVGDDDGNVLRFNNGNTDNGTAVTFSLVTKWHDISGARAYTDTITQLAALSRNAQGVKFQYQVNYPARENEWKTIGEIKKAPKDIFNTEIVGNRVRFRISGTSVGEPFIFQGIEILKGYSELVID